MHKIMKILMLAVLSLCVLGCSVDAGTEKLMSVSVTEGGTETKDTDKNEANQKWREMASENIVSYRENVIALCGLINGYRLENELSELELDDTLMKLAAHRSTENAYYNWMEAVEDENGTHHIRPDGSGIEELFVFYEKYGTYGEILGRRQKSIEEVFQDWKNSPEHDACMKKEDFELIGAGIARADNGDFYYTVVFLEEIQ